MACNTHYVGMMGCKGKNETVHDLVIGLGATEEGWARIKRPIGLKFGAKTTDELAVSIVASLLTCVIRNITAKRRVFNTKAIWTKRSSQSEGTNNAPHT